MLVTRGGGVAQWQGDALAEAIRGGLEVVAVAHCSNALPRRLSRRTFAHDALAWAVHRRAPSTRTAHVEPLVGPEVPHLHFEAVRDGAGQRIPVDVAVQLQGADVVIDFGMPLLAGVQDLPLTHGVLSYQDGDPADRWGRSASFSAPLPGAATQDVSVRLRTSDVGGGVILARATTRVVPHSFRKTLEAAHRAGVPLLGKALDALALGTTSRRPEQTGPTGRLPQTRTVLAQVVALSERKVARGLEGLLTEKRWRVGFAAAELDPAGENVLRQRDISELPMPRGFSFAADPFYTGSGGVLAELMDRWTGMGEIGHWDGSRWRTAVLELHGHASYPQLVRSADGAFVLPEVASFSRPVLFPFDPAGRTAEGLPLEGLADERVVDGTLHHDGEAWYLFGGRGRDTEHRLDLWVASDLLGPYAPHPASPICLDVRGARMAGPLAVIDGRLHRFGQDLSEGYGRAIRIHRVDLLSPTTYEEIPTGRVVIDAAAGPHTVSATPEGLLVDYYTERRTLLAGYRRVAAAVRRRRAA